jgi:hypothetical protein
MEWVMYHLELGFDQICIYDHLSNPPVDINHPQVHVCRVQQKNAIKRRAMFRAKRQAQSAGVNWAMYLDGDEFLVLRDHATVHDFVTDISPQHKVCYIPWRMFGTSGHITHPNGLLISNFTRCSAKTYRLGKYFYRPRMHTICYNHCCREQSREKHFEQICSDFQTVMPNNMGFPLPQRARWPAEIFHFYTQSEQMTRQRRCRPRDDSGLQRQYICCDTFCPEAGEWIFNGPGKKMTRPDMNGPQHQHHMVTYDADGNPVYNAVALHALFNDTEDTFLRDNFSVRVQRRLDEYYKTHPPIVEV